jgi:hypothetical protein
MCCESIFSWLAHQLHPYGIHTKTLWQGDHSAKGYVESDFHDIFRRYITKAQLDAIRAESNKEGRLEVSPPPKPAEPPPPPQPPPTTVGDLSQLMKLLKAAAQPPGASARGPIPPTGPNSA